MKNTAFHYDMRFNPLYQVDMDVAGAGKRVAGTKLRVRWRFGCSDAKAIASGMTSMNCRGSEHEIVLIWSLASGKRQIIADGVEVHYSKGRRTETKFEYSWTMFGEHIVKVIAHAAPPLVARPGFRQFDMKMDGCSFFSFPRIFELGTVDAVQKTTGHPAVAHSFALVPKPVHYESQHKEIQYEDILSQRIEDSSSSARSYQSLPEEPRVAVTPARTQSVPDFFSSPTTELVTADYWQSSSYQDSFTPMESSSPNPPAIANTPCNSEGAGYSQTFGYPVLANEPYTPVQQRQVQQPPQTFFASSESYQVSTNYKTADPAVLYHNTTPQQQPAETPAVVTPTMSPLSLTELEERDQPPLSNMEQAMKNLVNLTDITESLKTPEQMKRNKCDASKRSIPKPPTTPEWHLGRSPCLADIQKFASTKEQPPKEIMRVYTKESAGSGAMVVYGSNPGLSAPSGFGAGLYSSYYGQPIRQ